MSVAIKLSTSLISRVEHVKNETKGRVYGLVQNNAILVMGFRLTESVEDHLPIGFKELGLIQWSLDGNFSEPEEGDVVQLRYNLKSDNRLEVHSKNQSNEWESVSFVEVTEDDLKKEWICIRTQFHLKHSLIHEDETKSRDLLLKLLQLTRTRLCEEKKPILKVAGTEIILKKDKGLAGIGKNAKISAALQQTKTDQTQLNSYPFDTLDIVLQFEDGESLDDDTSSIFSSTFTEKLADTEKTHQIDFDAFAFVRISMGVNQLYEIILKSIDRNITCIEAFAENADRDLHTYVFYPKVLGHFISYVYNSAPSSDGSKHIEKRKQIHANLSLNRPYLRRIDVHSFKVEPAETKLVNPHIGLKSLVKDGKQYIVKGDYVYYHYMQDDFNDDGWGCAYRSFQTLFSWFRNQGYINRRVPTHGEIQKALIDIGDKKPSFQDSRNWIGSTEVSQCLQYFVNVDSRILHLSSGADMAQHGPTFAQHFTTYGTPIMIGGGVLAHTILGIDYNSQTNDLKFLVLDPHYTGSDDLAVVQKKGWCAWKPISFWDKKSFYNCCMPLFPDFGEY